RCRQRRRVVDPVPSHGDDRTLGFEFSNDFDLFIWHYFGLELIDAQLMRDRFSCPLIVACAHDDLQTHFMKFTDGLSRCRLDWISNSENANGFSVYRDPDCSLCSFLEAAGLFR